MKANTNPSAHSTKADVDHAQVVLERLKELTVHMPAVGYIRQAGLIPHILPFSPATLWRMVHEGRFPAPYKLSKRITAWKLTEVFAWANSSPKIRVHRISKIQT